MSNPFYTPLQAQNNPLQSFVSFMQNMKGQNPNTILNNLVSSGKISQQQLNVAQQKAKEMSGAFNGFRSMFGF